MYDGDVGHRLLATLGSAALAGEPVESGNFELGGFVGIEDFSSHANLGTPTAPEQRPQPSPVVGLRLGYLGRAFRHLDIGPEAELSLAPAWTGYGFAAGRASYFAPVISYRAGLIVRLRLPVFEPHAVIGVGGQSLVSDSPFIASDTDVVMYYGAGATIDVMPRWQIRVDGRRSMVPASGGGTTANHELLFGVVARLGSGAPQRHSRYAPTPSPVLALSPARRDACTNATSNNTDCPTRDQDRDSVTDPADKCPRQAEDVDQFEDSDGCPDPDNDTDGVLDATDPCPNRAETTNGFDDADGCPDSIPAFMTVALSAASSIRFEPGRARLTLASKRALDQVVVALRTPAAIRVVITAHPDSRRTELAEKRAAVVKWYLVDHGVPGDELHIRVSAVIKPAGPPIQIAITPK